RSCRRNQPCLGRYREAFPSRSSRVSSPYTGVRPLDRYRENRSSPAPTRVDNAATSLEPVELVRRKSRCHRGGGIAPSRHRRRGNTTKRRGRGGSRRRTWRTARGGEPVSNRP